MPALLLQHQVGGFFVDAQLALQQALGALHHLARFQLLGQLRLLILHARQLQLGAHQIADHRDQLNLALRVVVRLAVLHINGADQLAPAQDGHSKERLKAVLRQRGKTREPWIGPGFGRQRDGLLLLSHPARHALSHINLHPVHHVLVRIFRGAQHQLVFLQNVDEAGIAAHRRRHHVEHPLQHFMERVGRRHPAADIVQQIDVAGFFQRAHRFVQVLSLLTETAARRLQGLRCFA